MSHQRSPVSGRKRLLILLLAALPLVCSGCATFEGMFSKLSFGEDAEEDTNKTPDALIVKGMEAYDVGNYPDAIKAFNAILDEHPFSPQAMLAELKAADAHYYNKQYAEARVLYQGFSDRYPTNEAMPYVLFQIGMCEFARSDRIDRDVSGAQDAIKSFTKVVRTYPQSPYAKEAKSRIVIAQDFLVNHEYYVAVFHVRSENYEQAKHRLKYLLAMYPDSAIAPQAKALLDKLEEGKPPSWGMRKWLPDFTGDESSTGTAGKAAPMESSGSDPDVVMPQ